MAPRLHVKILGTYHTGLTRREALLRRHEKEDIKIRRDFADRLVAAFATAQEKKTPKEDFSKKIQIVFDQFRSTFLLGFNS